MEFNTGDRVTYIGIVKSFIGHKGTVTGYLTKNYVKINWDFCYAGSCPEEHLKILNEMIKVGDKVILKKETSEYAKGKLKNTHFPLAVETITDCEHYNSSSCQEIGCPGRINDECYGYDKVYVLEKANQDWDD